ncbi:BPSL0067 family protein [Pseudomonas mangiferae]|uniref:BPSL0067 family protein n=1 Tax=Pseudomonas mangiferae TaxID=2593654 RepID=A0A553H2U9_9PSED|nr:BPSL0067 family protein [Pseudomonas mangiferae]TRX76079.1 BPSL0067 family protein [Pseudomonas mangiferae]
MAYLARNPASYVGQSIGTGHCVPYVQVAANAPLTANWKRGERVKDIAELASGTAIATFDADGRYGSRKDGTSHAAIFIRKNETGIVVLDQWITNGVRKAVSERLIRFNNTAAKKINNGDEYYVIE